MSPLEARIAVLLMEITRDWGVVVQRSDEAFDTDARASRADAALVALSIDHAYQAFETVLTRLERSLGLPGRSGETWHAEILADAGVPIAGLRPAVYPPAAAAGWHDARRFRHFLRHAYAVELDPAKLTEVATKLRHAVRLTAPLVQGLLAQLSPDSECE